MAERALDEDADAYFDRASELTPDADGYFDYFRNLETN